MPFRNSRERAADAATEVYDEIRNGAHGPNADADELIQERVTAANDALLKGKRLYPYAVANQLALMKHALRSLANYLKNTPEGQAHLQKIATMDNGADTLLRINAAIARGNWDPITVLRLTSIKNYIFKDILEYGRLAISLNEFNAIFYFKGDVAHLNENGIGVNDVNFIKGNLTSYPNSAIEVLSSYILYFRDVSGDGADAGKIRREEKSSTSWAFMRRHIESALGGTHPFTLRYNYHAGTEHIKQIIVCHNVTTRKGSMSVADHDAALAYTKAYEIAQPPRILRTEPFEKGRISSIIFEETRDGVTTNNRNDLVVIRDDAIRKAAERLQKRAELKDARNAKKTRKREK